MTTWAQPAQIVSKHLKHDDANIGTGIVVATLNVGDLVEDAWVEITEAFNSATSDTCTVGIADNDLNPVQAEATYDVKGGVVAGADIAPAQQPATLGTIRGRAVTSACVYAKVVSVGGGTSAGEITVYAIIRRAEQAYAAPTPTVPTVDKGESASYVGA